MNIDDLRMWLVDPRLSLSFLHRDLAPVYHGKGQSKGLPKGRGALRLKKGKK